MKGTRKVGAAGTRKKFPLQFSPVLFCFVLFFCFFFHVHAFSIQRTRLSSSLEQALLELLYAQEKLETKVIQNLRGVGANEMHGIMGDVETAICSKLTLHKIKEVEIKAT